MKRLLLLLFVLLAGCQTVPKTAVVVPSATPEMLIQRPTRAPVNTPTTSDIMLTVTALAVPQTISNTFSPVEVGDFRLEYIGHSIETAAYTGTDYVEIRYRFTNNSTETTSFSWSISTKAFQNGIELNDYFLTGSESVTDIRPGMSIIVKDGFQIRSKQDWIELEFRPLLSLRPDTVTRTLIP